MNETLALLNEGFIRDALLAGLMVAIICGYLGVFVVLKRIVFVGAALAELASFGGALAFSSAAVWGFDALVAAVPVAEPLRHFKPLVLALFFMLLGVAFFSQQSHNRRLPREALIGAAYAGAIGLTVLLLSKVPDHAQHGQDMLTGNILGVEPQELREMAIVTVLVGALQLLFHKEFVLVSFDPEVAHTLGYRPKRWELLWYLSLGLMISVSIHVAGTVLVFAFLVLPAAIALLLSRRLTHVLVVAVLVAVLCTFLGTLISVSPVDVPTSPMIVACLVALLALVWTARTLWGLIAKRSG